MTHKLMLAALLALLSSAPALAQDTSTAFDSRWNPYLGCWTVLQDQSGHSAAVQAGTMVCVRPSGRFGVAITTTVDGKNVLEQTIVADGSAQPLSQGIAAGPRPATGRATASASSRTSSSTCAGRPKRAISGITLLANGQWVDAQATVVDGIADVRVRRYRRIERSIHRPGGNDDGAAQHRRHHRGEREGAVRGARGGARRSQRAIRAEQPRAHAACRQRRIAERHRSHGGAGLSREVPGRAPLLVGGVDVLRNGVGGQLDCLHDGQLDVSLSDVRPVLQQLLLLLALRVPVLLGPELHLSLRIAVLSELLLLQLLRGSRRRLLLRRRHRLGRQHRAAGIPGLARGQRSRRQRPRLHASATGRIGQHHHRRKRHAHEPLAELHARRAQPRQRRLWGQLELWRQLVFFVRIVRVVGSSGASSGGYSSGSSGGGGNSGGGRTAQPR